MSTSDPVQRVLDQLHGVKSCGPDKWEAFCPAHENSPDGHKRSLSIGRGEDGRALFNCHAGCDKGDVVKAIGLSMADLFVSKNGGKKPKASRGKIVRAYDYIDADGTLLYQVVRFEPKDFRQRRPDGKGDWIWNLKGVPRVLYRLRELLAADKDAWVFVVEGEKDADTLVSLGLVATTNPGGAGKWSKLADDVALKNRRVAIVPDCDEPGRKHAEDVAHHLHGKAADVRIIGLDAIDGFTGKDPTDWVESLDGRTPEELSRALVSMVDTACSWVPKADCMTGTTNGAEPEEMKKPSQAEALVRLALERCRLGVTEAGEPFAVEVGGPNIARLFRGGHSALRTALARDYRRAHGKTANASALADALTTLEGEALEATAEAVALRVAEYDSAIVVDLGDQQGRGVVVGPKKWEVVPKSPVLFRRTALTGAMPVPEKGGTLDELRSLLNVSEDTWPLVRGWMVASLWPSVPHPILLLGGEQGTGKSTAARMLVDLIDPSPAQLRSEPRDVEAWAMAASGSWLVAVDNISRIKGWFSDALCRVVTGDGWIRRRLYTDADLSVLSFRRVVILTSIDAGALRGDLGDRLVLADLKRIAEADRKTEADLKRAFEAARPRILGALFDMVADVLARLPEVTASSLPRMADFARILAALDSIDNGPTKALDLYCRQAGRVAMEVLDDDPVAQAVLDLLDRHGGHWEGTAGKLLEETTPERPPRSWPKTPRAMSGRLTRLTPALRTVDIEVSEPGRSGHSRDRLRTIERTTF